MGIGSILGQKNKILHAVWHGAKKVKKKQKQNETPKFEDPLL